MSARRPPERRRTGYADTNLVKVFYCPMKTSPFSTRKSGTDFTNY